MNFQQIAEEYKLTLLAPGEIPFSAKNVDRSSTGANLLGAIQRARGTRYLADGAIPASALTEDGRHEEEIDYVSWHLVTFLPSGEIGSAVRFTSRKPPHDLSRLRLMQFVSRLDPVVSQRVAQAVEREIEAANFNSMQFAENGGWHSDLNAGPQHAIATVIAIWALSTILNTPRSLALSSSRHSATIMLRRIGADILLDNDGMHSTFDDPYFNCSVSILLFDNSRIAPRYQAALETAISVLPDCPIYTISANA